MAFPLEAPGPTFYSPKSLSQLTPKFITTCGHKSLPQNYVDKAKKYKNIITQNIPTWLNCPTQNTNHDIGCGSLSP